MSTSIGIAMFPQHARTTAELISRADTAMRVAKKSESGQAVFAAKRETGSSRQHALLISLRQGVARGELILHYQPKVDLATGRVSGVEALVRWQHPVLGLLGPGSFIPDVDRTELIEPITRWVLNEALSQQRSWREVALDLTMAVNISDHSLNLNSDLPETVAELIDASGAEPGSLTLELSERGVVETAAGASDILARLHKMGVRLSIDDFGTGHSSITDLYRLPIDELKIDRTFVTHLAARSNDETIVRSTIQLAHNLGLTVVAEGVENEVALDLLVAHGCDSAEGFYFGAAYSPEALTRWLIDSPYGAPT
jgi:EAL domain-containing protein (putative c-di-GMP-specific phosphodiesterase class I)